MKTQETIGLNLAATVSVGLISSLFIVIAGGASNQPLQSQHSISQPTLSLIPLALSFAAAFFQYAFVMKPWHKALGELVAKSLGLQEPTSESLESSETPKILQRDQLNVLRQSIETASVQYKDARQREKTLLQHAVDVICVIDLNGKFLSVNPAVMKVWGYKPEELTGKPVTDFLVSDDVKNTMKAIIGAEKSIDRIFFENRFQKKSGEIVDLLWSAHLSASDRGLFCIAHDITDRKRAERLLKESEERIRGILESLPAGVALINREGKLDFLNNTAIELTGFSKDLIRDTAASELFSFISADDTFDETIARATGASLSFDCQVVKSSGERFPAEASTSILSWGASTACLIVFLDATMKFEVERAKREFVAMVSHDLRTPLTTISLIFAYLLDGLGGELSEDGMEFAGKGQSSCQRLMTLVQDLLDLEKMRAGKFVMDMVETSVKELIIAAVSAVEPYADSQEIHILSVGQDENCYCDEGRIIQVLVNLLSNAIKFSVPNGTVTIESKSDDEFVTVSVSNRGRTIASDKLLSIFEKFEQANSREAIERKGTGLGLTISKTLVEQHGGKIYAESSDEDGTKFSFTLPKAEKDQSAP